MKKFKLTEQAKQILSKSFNSKFAEQFYREENTKEFWSSLGFGLHLTEEVKYAIEVVDDVLLRINGSWELATTKQLTIIENALNK